MNTDDLWAGAVEAKPRDYDWSEGYAEKWEVINPPGAWCSDCGEFKAGDEGERCPTCDGELYDPSESGNEPMMSYFYPVPGLRQAAEEAADLLDKAHVALCLVYFMDETEDNAYALALSGGGMDLSWDICRAYMALGYLPPLHFCDLPDMAGTDYEGQNVKDTLAACKASAQVAIKWAQGTLDKLNRLGQKEG